MGSRKTDPIEKVENKNSTVYRFRIDVGRRADGGRDQRTFTYPTLKEAKAERAKILAEKAKGTFIASTNLLLGDYLDAWLEGKRKLRAGTKRLYKDTLKPVKERLGNILLHKLTKADVDKLVTWRHTLGRRVGNKRKKSVEARTVNYMLMVLSQALDSAERQGLIGRNVVKLVERLGTVKGEMKTWTDKQAQKFLRFTRSDRLHVAYVLSLYGMRRGEVVGLRWSAVDLTGEYAVERGLEPGTPSVWVRVSRGQVAGVIVEDEPKTQRGRRYLPLDAELVSSMRVLHSLQRTDQLCAGEAYDDGDYVICDELGRPYYPDRYSATFRRTAKRLGLPVIRLHDARHTTATLMHLLGVPMAVISAWLGHASADFTMRTYTHSQNAELGTARSTLNRALGRSENV